MHTFTYSVQNVNIAAHTEEAKSVSMYQFKSLRVKFCVDIYFGNLLTQTNKK